VCGAGVVIARSLEETMKKIIRSMFLTAAGSLAIFGSAGAAGAEGSLRTGIDQDGNLEVGYSGGDLSGQGRGDYSLQAQAESLWVCANEQGTLLGLEENRVTLPSTLDDKVPLAAIAQERPLTLDLPPRVSNGAPQLTCPDGYRPALTGVRYDQIRAWPEGGAVVQGAPVAWVNQAFSGQVTARTTERGTFEVSFIDKGVTGANVVELGRQNQARAVDDGSVQDSFGGQGVIGVDVVEPVAPREAQVLGANAATRPCDDEARARK
jgi:hypothetical protein